MNKINVTRANPALIIFTVDMSGSMSEEVFCEHRFMPKSEALTRIVNLTIYEIECKCRNGNTYNDYFNIVVLGYDGGGVTSLLEKYNKAKTEFSTINDLKDANKIYYQSYPIVDGVKKPCSKEARDYISITPMDKTPMFAALNKAYELGKKWINAKGANSVPPIFINITDGEANDANESDLLNTARKIKSLHTAAGNALLVNVHIGSATVDSTIIFPYDKKDLDSIEHANMLYEMSSELPEWISEQMSDIIGRKWIQGDKLRALSYNTSITQLLSILQIGSLSK